MQNNNNLIQDKIYTSGIIIIGNEILSGKTQDKNIKFLAKELHELGIRTIEVSVIPDVKETIISKVTEFSNKFDYVFTTGGLGPTHDDITSESIAEAFNVKCVLNQKALSWLQTYYNPSDINEARFRMAHIPDGAELIYNPVTLAPGFRIKNVYVMAGVPDIAKGMFESFKNHLVGGKKILSQYIYTYLTEGTFASDLTIIQNNNPEVEIGSYPFIYKKNLGTTLVIRSIDQKLNQKVAAEITEMIINKDGKIIDLSLELEELK